VSEEASGAAPEPLVPAPMVAAPAEPAEPHGRTSRPSPQASSVHVRAAVVKFLRTTIPLVRLRTATAARPALTSLALGVPPEPPASKAVATADEEPRPLPPFEGPGSPKRPYPSGYGVSSPSGGGFPAGMAAVSALLACTLLFERLVVAFTSCQSESFVSLRERPG
jgi:hypothetical protein